MIWICSTCEERVEGMGWIEPNWRHVTNADVSIILGAAKDDVFLCIACILKEWMEVNQ